MSTTSMAIFSNPLFATYSVYARNASIASSTTLSWKPAGMLIALCRRSAMPCIGVW